MPGLHDLLALQSILSLCGLAALPRIYQAYSCLRPLHLLFPLLEMLFLQMLTWLDPFTLSDLT